MSSLILVKLCAEHSPQQYRSSHCATCCLSWARLKPTSQLLTTKSVKETKSRLETVMLATTFPKLSSMSSQLTRKSKKFTKAAKSMTATIFGGSLWGGTSKLMKSQMLVSATTGGALYACRIWSRLSFLTPRRTKTPHLMKKLYSQKLGKRCVFRSKPLPKCKSKCIPIRSFV